MWHTIAIIVTPNIYTGAKPKAAATPRQRLAQILVKFKKCSPGIIDSRLDEGQLQLLFRYALRLIVDEEMV